MSEFGPIRNRLPRTFGRPLDSRWLFYFLLCFTVLTRANQLETAVHGCRILLIHGLVSIMSLSCFKFSTQSDQPCRNLSHLYFWLIRSFTDPVYTCSIFVVRFLAYCLHVQKCPTVWTSSGDFRRFVFQGI